MGGARGACAPARWAGRAPAALKAAHAPRRATATAPVKRRRDAVSATRGGAATSATAARVRTTAEAVACACVAHAAVRHLGTERRARGTPSALTSAVTAASASQRYPSTLAASPPAAAEAVEARPMPSMPSTVVEASVEARVVEAAVRVRRGGRAPLAMSRHASRYAASTARASRAAARVRRGGAAPRAVRGWVRAAA
eukprot:scaffold117510_cov66-Phaeocystis_antarctica.AAC.3